MADMKTVCVVLLGLCLLVGVVHGVQPDPAWQFSVDGNVADDNEGGHLVPDTGFQYSFDTAGFGGNANQFSENNFADIPEHLDTSSDANSFGDEGYVYNSRSEDNAAPYDYNNNQFSTQTDETHALGVPVERYDNPEYVYDAHSGNGPDDASFATLDSQESDGNQDPAYVYDATAPSNEEGNSFSTQTGNDTAAPSTEHHGPTAFYTPASDGNGAFHFYDPRSEEEKKVTSVLDEDPATGAESFSQHHDSNGDTTVGSTSPILATAAVPEGTHGCPDTYWALHVDQWPVEVKITTPVFQAFGGVNLRKNLEIIFGTTTVFQALLDTREDPYSKLLRNAVAALINAYARPDFTLKPADVSKQFHAALVSKTLAAEQAQKFENENHAFGDSECK